MCDDRARALTLALADTPFEDGSFRLTLTFTDAYPNKPPTVRFVSRMFHPNIYNNGELCLDILQNRWSPTYDVAAILTSVQSLLNDPNPSRWVKVWWQLLTLQSGQRRGGHPVQGQQAGVRAPRQGELLLPYAFADKQITVEQSWVDEEELVAQAAAATPTEEDARPAAPIPA